MECFFAELGSRVAIRSFGYVIGSGIIKSLQTSWYCLKENPNPLASSHPFPSGMVAIATSTGEIAGNALKCQSKFSQISMFTFHGSPLLKLIPFSMGSPMFPSFWLGDDKHPAFQHASSASWSHASGVHPDLCSGDTGIHQSCLVAKIKSSRNLLPQLWRCKAAVLSKG